MDQFTHESRGGDARKYSSLGWICIFFGLLMLFSQGCTSKISQEDETAAVDAARAWLTLMDAEQYAAGWQAAAAFLKESVTEDKWVETMAIVRKPMGSPLSRKVESTKYRTMRPHALKGHYLIIKYKTSFANKPQVEESLTMMKEADGTWRVGGYHLE